MVVLAIQMVSILSKDVSDIIIVIFVVTVRPKH